MCVLAAAALPALAVGAGTAGATAAGGLTLGQLALAGGTALAGVGSIVGGVQANQQQAEHARQLEERARVETMLGSVEDKRTRDAMRAEYGRMVAQLAGRGVQLDSPAALALGARAARETSVASQDVRSRAGARRDTLTAEARRSQALGRSALVQGGLSAAGPLLTAAPDLWPGLADVRVLS
ncbi:MAG: hypothetical protein AAF899_09700 [Pseudomonadota bacterium]